MDKSWRRISWLILGIGGLIVAGGLALGYGSVKLVLYGERAPSIVTAIERENEMYAPVFKFRLPTTGEMREVKALGSGAPAFAVGDEVTVIYSPADPGDFAIDDFDELWLSAIIVTGFGCFWLMFGAIAWALSREVDLAVVGERAFMTIAGVAAVLATIATWNASALYRSGLRADGKVTEIRVSHYTDQEEVVRGGREGRRDVQRTSYAPVVRFTTAEGRAIEFLGRGGSGTAYREGDVVTVAYDPARPITAHIVSFVDLWLPAAVACGVAILFGGCAWISRRLRLRAA